MKHIALYACENRSSGATLESEWELQSEGKALTKCLAGNLREVSNLVYHLVNQRSIRSSKGPI